MICSSEKLEKSYHESERCLKYASSFGDEKLLKQEMKKHADYEYALLYQNTPEFRKKAQKLKVRF